MLWMRQCLLHNSYREYRYCKRSSSVLSSTQRRLVVSNVSLDLADVRSRIEHHHKISDIQDWYKITKLRESVLKIYGVKFLRSVETRQDLTFAISLLHKLYPNHRWQPWKFRGTLPPKWFSEPQNLRNWFQWAAEQLNKSPSESFEHFWNRIEPTDVQRLAGGRKLIVSNGSLIASLRIAYPEYSWSEKLSRNSESLRLRAAEHLKAALNVKTPHDWYSVKMDTIDALPTNLKSSFKSNFRGSIYVLASSVEAQDHAWEEWKFDKVPKSFWRTPSNRMRYLKSVAHRLGFDAADLERWYAVDPDQVFVCDGKSVLQSYSGLYALLSSAYPNHRWESSLFLEKQRRESTLPQSAARMIAEQVASNLKIFGPDEKMEHNLEKWYDVSASQFQAAGGGQLILQHNGSLFRALKSAFPDYQWLGFLFKNLPRGYFMDNQNRADCVAFFERLMKISHPDQWTQLTLQDIENQYPKYAYALTRLVRYNGGSLSTLLAQIYPDRRSLFLPPTSE